ncbi:MAG: hydroxyethylthiazole kinase [Negativicutes bacterium]|nr:hydroxyethylthiazole kinase [Negativicutes bacterium]
MELLQQAAETLARVRAKNPLVHHLTNYVTANDCANMTLAVGASPVMASDPAEVEDMVAAAAALVLNLGTLDARRVGAMLAAGKKAVCLGIPVILDPVGAGATPFRTAAAGQIIREVSLAVIRGNLAEIRHLAGLKGDIKGVDSSADDQDGRIVAQSLARRLGCVVAITGKTDIVACDGDVCRIDNGHPLLRQVTGTGCMASSLVGCCSAVADPFVGAVTGIMLMGIAGELAQQSLRPPDGIGTFRMRLFDAVGNMTAEQLRRCGKIS